MLRKPYFSKVRRIVVKIGSSSLTENGVLSAKKISSFASDISFLVKKKYEVIIVSSGAISAGAGLLGLKREKMSIPQKQGMAAVGQTVLMKEYSKAFEKFSISVGQILLTEEDFKSRVRYINIRNTVNELLKLGVVPIVNENDTVAVNEIKVGDNDTLSAYVTNTIDADLLILLTDIDGFYYNLSDEKCADIVEKIDSRVFSAAKGSGSVHGTGGMQTKLKAADMVTKSGKLLSIAKADEKSVISRVILGEKIGTVFLPSEKYIHGKKRWISFNMQVKGKIIVDDGARKALVGANKSLLPGGVVGSTGKFSSGDGIEISDLNGVVFAKGITNYSSAEIEIIKGKKSIDIKKAFGESYYEELVHRDNMILINQG